MFKIFKKYNKLFVMALIFFFSTATGFANIKTCLKSQCNMGKTEKSCSGQDHSCCTKKASINYKQASKCECNISAPRDLIFENKDTKDNLNTQNNLANLYMNDNDEFFLAKEKNIAVNISSKKHFLKIFLKDCSLLL